MKLGIMAAAVAVTYALPVWGQDVGECFTLDELLAKYPRHEYSLVDQRSLYESSGSWFPAGLQFLIRGPDGQYVEFSTFGNGRYCDVRELPGDPTKPAPRA